MRIIGYIYIIIYLFLFLSCEEKNMNSPIEPVASVYDTVLSKAMIEEIVPSELTGKEKIIWERVYAENWVRDQLVLHEARKHTPKELDIEQLVNDYRESLLKLQFEKKLIKINLDTVISKDELKTLYNETKDQYLLKEPIIQCSLAKVSEKKKRIDKFYESWKKKDIKSIKSYAEKNAEKYWIDDDKWLTVEDFYAFIPKSLIKSKNLKRKGLIQKNKNKYEYFIHIYDYKDINEVPPLTYIKTPLEKIILLKRKNELITTNYEDLYNREIENKNIKFYNTQNDIN